MKNIAVLGSTGSIGTQTLEVVRQHKDDLNVTALSAGKNIQLLEQQIREFHPNLASVQDEKDAQTLRIRISDLNVLVLSGAEGLIAVAEEEAADILVTGIVGMIGIRPTIAAIQAGKDVALANKETLVTAGHIIMPLAREKHIRILPVDSEHSAIFQSLQGNEGNRIDRILLTASGGPFRGMNRRQLENVNLEDALQNPNWSMGKKVTIDSATMVNKGLEVMEARWLFDVDPDQIEVVVHPQSVVHSAVQYEDGAVIAQLGTPDMKIPIQYALLYPKRKPLSGKRLNLFQIGSLTFERPDEETFYGLHLAKKSLKAGGSCPTVFNAANEVAVAKFLKGEIRFPEIPELIEYCLDRIPYIESPDTEELFEVQKQVEELIESR